MRDLRVVGAVPAEEKPYVLTEHDERMVERLEDALARVRASEMKALSIVQMYEDGTGGYSWQASLGQNDGVSKYWILGVLQGNLHTLTAEAMAPSPLVPTTR